MGQNISIYGLPLLTCYIFFGTFFIDECPRIALEDRVKVFLWYNPYSVVYAAVTLNVLLQFFIFVIAFIEFD